MTTTSNTTKSGSKKTAAARWHARRLRVLLMATAMLAGILFPASVANGVRLPTGSSDGVRLPIGPSDSAPPSAITVAATSHAGGFSSLLPYNPERYEAAAEGCRFAVGVAADLWHTDKNFHHFGGGEVTCTSYHRLTLYVVQQRHANGAVQDVSTVSWSGYVRNFYLTTGPACKAGDRYASFKSWIYVYIDGRGSGWLPSRWQQNPDLGCLWS